MSELGGHHMTIRHEPGMPVPNIGIVCECGWQCWSTTAQDLTDDGVEHLVEMIRLGAPTVPNS